MKVAYLINQYPHVSHSFIRREIAALERQGIDIDRYSIRASGEEMVDEDDQAEQRRTEVLLTSVRAIAIALAAAAVGQPVRFFTAVRAAIRLGRRSDRGVLRHLAYLAEGCLLARHMRARRTQHLHAHFGTNPAAVALLAHLICGIPYSFTVHGPEEFDRPDALSLADKIAYAAFVVAISDFGRSQLFRWCPHGDWQKIRVVRCGVDATFLAAELKPLPSSPRLVCVGRLCEQKGALLLLQALAPLAAEGIDFHLTLAGDGVLRSVIEEEIRRLHLSNRVRITGWISNRDVREEIQSARLFVLPSFAEGLPVVLMEALALGRPVISTYVAGIPELVRSGVNGWLVPAGSTIALTETIREALTATTGTLTALGRAGAIHVAAQHDAGREAAKLARLFARSIHPRHPKVSVASEDSRELTAIPR